MKNYPELHPCNTLYVTFFQLVGTCIVNASLIASFGTTAHTYPTPFQFISLFATGLHYGCFFYHTYSLEQKQAVDLVVFKLRQKIRFTRCMICQVTKQTPLQYFYDEMDDYREWNLKDQQIIEIFEQALLLLEVEYHKVQQEYCSPKSFDGTIV